MNISAPYYWLAIIVVMSIMEACTCQLVSIWFVVGATVSFIMSLFGMSVISQVVVFAVVSLFLVAVTKPLVKKFISQKRTETNSDQYINKDGIVIEEINNLNGTGQVKISGITWTARALNNDVIPKDRLVKVEKIEGVKLIVTQKGELK